MCIHHIYDIVLDSWGRRESLFFEGDNVWEGSWDTCGEYEELWSAGGEGLPAKYCNVEWVSLAYPNVSTNSSQSNH